MVALPPASLDWSATSVPDDDGQKIAADSCVSLENSHRSGETSSGIDAGITARVTS